MPFSKRARQIHIRQGGIRCPYCKHTDIEGDSVDIEAGMSSQRVRCLHCGKLWKDIYQLADIAEED